MHFRRKYLQLQHDLALAVVEEGGAEAMHGRNVQRPLPGGRDSPASHYSTEDDGAEPGRTMVAAFATPDDAVRFLSFIYAMSKAIDKATLLARIIVTDEWMLCSRLDRNIQQRLLWIGIGHGKRKQRQLDAHSRARPDKGS